MIRWANLLFVTPTSRQTNFNMIYDGNLQLELQTLDKLIFNMIRSEEVIYYCKLQTQASTYEACDRSPKPLHTPKTLETC